MLSDELMRKVRRIEITTRRSVDSMMSGRYKSHFKGHGVQFSEHREYVAGDDIRHIDWKVSARTRDPLIKKFDEERELTALIVLDISGSDEFGSKVHVKREMAAEVGGMLAYTALKTGDKVGLLTFSGKTEKMIHPAKGRQQTLRIIREMLAAKSMHAGTDLAGALDAATRLMKHAGIVFVLSDFQAKGYDKALKRLARRNDVVAILLEDPLEKNLKNLGQVLLFNPETNQQQMVDTNSYGFKKWLEDFNQERGKNRDSALKSSRVEQIRISTEEDYAEAVVRFFKARARKKR